MEIDQERAFKYFCGAPGPTNNDANSDVPYDAASAQVNTTKLWEEGVKHLKVLFLNPEQLDQYGLNPTNIIDRANLNWHARSSVLPEFTETKILKHADIIVKIGKETVSDSFVYIAYTGIHVL